MGKGEVVVAMGFAEFNNTLEERSRVRRISLKVVLRHEQAVSGKRHR